MNYEVVLTEQVHEKACNFLLRHVRQGRSQEELCFALWRPSTGAMRKSALIFDTIFPKNGERELHGNTSFYSSYLTRAVKLACAKKVGLAFMHNHLTDGWQEMSAEDVIAERDRISPPTRASGLPLVGLTLGTDGSWSARFWLWDGNSFNRSWCDKVRVVGRMLHITFNAQRMPPPRRREILRRTIDTWGEKCQQDIARLQIGVVGVGSVGFMVAESLARIGVQKLVLIDPDKIKEHNLDRLLYATKKNIGENKVDFAAQHLTKSATAENFQVQTYNNLVQNKRAYLTVLDCDVLFVAVDRPLPKDLLNRIAYAHCIPVIFGGIYISNKPDGALGQATWSVAAVGLERRCLRCDGQYSSSEVTMERDGSLDAPGYLQQAVGNGPPSNQNVFPFSVNLASFMVIEMVRIVVSERWWPDRGGKLLYGLIPSRLHVEQKQCDANCSISKISASGDGYKYPFIVDTSEEVSQTTSGTFIANIRDWCLKLLNAVRK